MVLLAAGKSEARSTIIVLDSVCRSGFSIMELLTAEQGMVHVFSEFVHVHAKAFGLAGDSLTFAGGVFLAIDALFKKTEGIRLAATRRIATDFAGSQTQAGEPLSPTRTEEDSVNHSVLFARIGACALTTGFFCLLLIRLFAE